MHKGSKGAGYLAKKDMMWPREFLGVQVKPLNIWITRNFPKKKYPMGRYDPFHEIIYCHLYLSESELENTLKHEYRHHLQFRKWPFLKVLQRYYYTSRFDNGVILLIFGIFLLFKKFNFYITFLGFFIVVSYFLLEAYLEYDASKYAGQKSKSRAIMHLLIGVWLVIVGWYNDLILSLISLIILIMFL